MKFKIRPLSPELKEEYLSFFESIKFEEHPHWSACYCYSFHFTGSSEEWKPESNRSCVSAMIDEGSMKGYLAFSDGKPVGWCNVNNRLNYQLLTKKYDLLDRVIKDYTAQDYAFIEAYPRSGDLSSEKLYRGPMEIYTRNGFDQVGEFEDYVLVRKGLK